MGEPGENEIDGTAPVQPLNAEDVPDDRSRRQWPGRLPNAAIFVVIVVIMRVVGDTLGFGQAWRLTAREQ